MQINLLKKVVEKIAGVPAVKIVDLLYHKNNINEFLIAKKLKLTINQTRNLLYRLSHLGIIHSIRKKDKRKGWYIYFWSLNILKSLEFLEDSLKQEIQALQSQLVSKRMSRAYKCSICGREASEESALLNNFTCTECGEVYVLADNAPIVKSMEEEMAKVQKELNFVESEIGKENQEKGKKLQRLLKKEQKMKKALRMEKAKILKKSREKEKRALLKKKLLKHKGKKPNRVVKKHKL